MNPNIFSMKNNAKGNIKKKERISKFKELLLLRLKNRNIKNEILKLEIEYMKTHKNPKNGRL